ncbi:MAG TPA: 2OG-Fe(II) oxygenase [Pseudomonadota bacterium]|nr:2OG-Fe(II) oxygenase [Pseudomonadota bacterium]
MNAVSGPVVATTVLGEVSRWRAAFDAAQPFRHVVIDDFLDAGFVQALLAEFPRFEDGNSVGDDGRPGGKSTLERMATIGPSYRRLDEVIQGAAFLEFISAITGIPDLLYDPFHLGGGTHENRDGQSLQAHIDFNYHPSERWHRRLNLIVYLNDGWQQAWGGSLELFRDPYVDRAPARRIAPVFNRCVIFETTEHSWHGFDRIVLPPEESARSRKSVALYFYTKDRPAAETAGKHSTHYVDAQLPERFVEGRVLDAIDVATLHTLIAQRDGQLQRLYAENARLLQAQERGLGGQILYLLKRAYVRFRR